MFLFSPTSQTHWLKSLRKSFSFGSEAALFSPFAAGSSEYEYKKAFSNFEHSQESLKQKEVTFQGKRQSCRHFPSERTRLMGIQGGAHFAHREHGYINN
ncbi:hypothetical protein D3C72_1406350 [compost metagenome]